MTVQEEQILQLQRQENAQFTTLSRWMKGITAVGLVLFAIIGGWTLTISQVVGENKERSETNVRVLSGIQKSHEVLHDLVIRLDENLKSINSALAEIKHNQNKYQENIAPIMRELLDENARRRGMDAMQ